MHIDTARIDEKIRKLEQIKKLAADPEMAELLLELVTKNGDKPRISTKIEGNGKRTKGEFMETVEKLCLTFPSRFTVNDVVIGLQNGGYTFTAHNPSVATYSALRRLTKHHVISLLEKGRRGKPAKFIVSKAHTSN